MSEMPHRSTKESVLWSCIQPLLKKRCPHEGKRRPKSTAIVRSGNSGSRFSPRAAQASRQKLQRQCLQQDNDAETPPSPAMTRVIARFSPATPSPHCTPGLDARIHNHLADHLRRRRWPPPPRPGPEPPTSSCRGPSPEAACRAGTKDAHDGSRNHHQDPNGIQIGHPSRRRDLFVAATSTTTLVATGLRHRPWIGRSGSPPPRSDHRPRKIATAAAAARRLSLRCPRRRRREEREARRGGPGAARRRRMGGGGHGPEIYT